MRMDLGSLRAAPCYTAAEPIDRLYRSAEGLVFDLVDGTGTMVYVSATGNFQTYAGSVPAKGEMGEGYELFMADGDLYTRDLASLSEEHVDSGVQDYAIMGGSISVRSVKGEGSTFTVLLPLRVADDAPQTEEVQAEAARPSERPYRVLVVEDVELNRSLAEAVLEEGGFLFESVVDGREAVRAVDEHPLWYYDLVLMDIQMPVMDGYTATRAIRALPRADVGSLPIVALSANAREEDRRMSLESGMDDHVAKPFDFDGLLNTISEHIARRGEQQG
jgi:CheY-like chemotaxis protein